MPAALPTGSSRKPPHPSLPGTLEKIGQKALLDPRKKKWHSNLSTRVLLLQDLVNVCQTSLSGGGVKGAFGETAQQVNSQASPPYLTVVLQ